MNKSIDVRTPGIQAIAKKWKLSIAEVMRLVNDGAKVEKEHTKSLAKARQVARDHIAERPDYYKKLHKMEKSPISMKEETGILGIRGLGNVTGDPALDPVNQYIDTNALAYDDYNGAILRMIRNRHNQHAPLGFTAYDPTDNHQTNKPLKESDESTKALVRTVAKKKLKDIQGKKKSQALRDKLTRKMNLKELGDYDKSGSVGAEGLSDASPRSMKKIVEDESINEISAELVGKVSNARFFRGEAPSKVLTRAINKKFIESGKKDKGKINKDKKEVKEAVMAMPPQVQPPAIHGSQRAGVQRQVSRPTSVSGSASGRIAGQTGSMSARPNVKVSSGVQPSIERSWKTSGRGTMGTSGGSMSATPKVSTAYSQGGVNVGGKMAASKQTSPVVKGMTSAGREATAVVTKAAPTVAKGLGTVARIAGGPAATAAMAVMSPTAANAGEDEKKRQETLKSYNPYKSSGRSASDYEKQALTPQKYDKPETPKVDAPMAPKRPDYFSRGQAFQAARGEAGGSGGKFSYGGKEYQTNVAGEKYASKPKQTSVTDIKETKMDTKDLINEALDYILEENLVEMKENLKQALQEKAMEKLEERKKEIAANYFAE